MKAAFFCAALCFLAAGCAGPESFGGSREGVASWAAPRGFQMEAIEAGGFRMLSLLRQQGRSPSLPIYIEGDGAPWPSAFRPPRDPTPLRPVSLILAERDLSRVVAYLGRPCQYLGEADLAHCDGAYWSGRRFSPEVLAAMDVAVSHLKEKAGANVVTLVGYSGGGVIAALLAMRRNDVEGLITIAAPLALSEWARVQNLTLLSGSLDPLLQPPVVGMKSAVHFAGADDTVVPPDIVARFVRTHGGRLEVVADFDHDCCWGRDWAQLLGYLRSKEGRQ